MRRWLLLFAAVLTSMLPLAPAAGQTTQPSSGDWPSTVSGFAQSLVASDPAALLPLVADNVSVQAFDAKTADAVRLLARIRGGALVFSKEYTKLPPALAADIAEAFRAAPVPDEIKTKLTPPDETQMRRANQIAAQWLVETLSAKDGDLLGVLIFWCAKPVSATAPDASELVFVLVKGAIVDNRPRIQTIAFGDPAK